MTARVMAKTITQYRLRVGLERAASRLVIRREFACPGTGPSIRNRLDAERGIG